MIACLPVALQYFGSVAKWPAAMYYTAVFKLIDSALLDCASTLSSPESSAMRPNEPSEGTRFDLVTPGEGSIGWALAMVLGLITRYSQENEDTWRVSLPWLLCVS